MKFIQLDVRPMDKGTEYYPTLLNLDYILAIKPYKDHIQLLQGNDVEILLESPVTFAVICEAIPLIYRFRSA